MTTVINVKTSPKVKKAAQHLASELGLSLSAVVNGYLRQFVRDKEVYFSKAPKMKPQLEALLDEIHGDIARGKNFSPALSSPKEIRDYLRAL